MASIKPGQKEVRVVLDETSETYITLQEWGQRRGLTPGRALRVIATDWSDAINGRPNPFAAAIAAAGGNSTTGGGATVQTAPAGILPEMSAEDQAKQAALLEAAEQFL